MAMTALEIALLKLGLETASPGLMLALAEAKQGILNYCNYGDDEELPAALNFVWADMAMALMATSHSEATGADIAPVGALTSLTMGDTSYSFATPQKTKQDHLDAVLGNYTVQLNKFRRLIWP
ncbi:MAG: hypothetical protein FWE76_01945 [Symbiobacteriaceae bacterium]|nr:hypothetical protein [Symbiobacteriaceae bacterium]